MNLFNYIVMSSHILPAMLDIKTYGSGFGGPKDGECGYNVSILTQRAKYNFTPICSSVISFLNKTHTSGD